MVFLRILRFIRFCQEAGALLCIIAACAPKGGSSHSPHSSAHKKLAPSKKTSKKISEEEQGSQPGEGASIPFSSLEVVKYNDKVVINDNKGTLLANDDTKNTNIVPVDISIPVDTSVTVDAPPPLPSTLPSNTLNNLYEAMVSNRTKLSCPQQANISTSSELSTYLLNKNNTLQAGQYCYKSQGKLAEGAQGTVFLLEQALVKQAEVAGSETVTGAFFVLKVLKRSISSIDDMITLYLCEQDFHQKHFNTAPKHAVLAALVYVESIPALFKSYVKGKDIKTMLEEGIFGPKRAEEFLQFLLNVTDSDPITGLSHVYQDLNPCNIIYGHVPPKETTENNRFIIIDGEYEASYTNQAQALERTVANVLAKLYIPNKVGEIIANNAKKLNIQRYVPDLHTMKKHPDKLEFARHFIDILHKSQKILEKVKHKQLETQTFQWFVDYDLKQYVAGFKEKYSKYFLDTE